MFCVLLCAVAGLSAIMPLPYCLSQNPQPTASTKKSASKPASSTPVVTARGLYTETLAALLLDHDQKKATNGFLKVVQIDPHFAAAWFNLGLIAESESSWIQAESYFHMYLAYAPNGPDAQRAKDQLVVLSKYASGEITPQTAKSTQYDALIQRSRVFLAAGHSREAIAEAGRAQAIDISRWEAYAVVSLCMSRQNKTKEAAQFASLAIDRAPADKRDRVRTALTSSGSTASTSTTMPQESVPEQSGTVNSTLTPQVNPERNEAKTSQSRTETAVAPAQGIISDNDRVWSDPATVVSPVAILHVVRNTHGGWDSFPIRLDGVSWFVIQNKRSYRLAIPAGSHAVSAGVPNSAFTPSSIIIEASPKGEYWLSVSYKRVWSSATISFVLLSAEEGARQMQGTQETIVDRPTLQAPGQHR
jgi:tetratricopeptide (TPR) repeat protein